MTLRTSLTLVLATALMMPAGGCLRVENQSGPSPEGELEVKVTGPQRAKVGERVTFTLAVTNRGQVPASGLLARVSFDAGLEHDVGPGPIENDLAELAPGQTQRVDVTFRVTRPGRLGVTAEVEQLRPSTLAKSQAAVESVGTAAK